MKELFFLIDKYSFSNNLLNLKNYLDKLEIEYKIKSDVIEFYFFLHDIRVWCEGKIHKDKICNYSFYSKCDENESKILKSYISSYYPKKYLKDDMDFTYYTSYEENGLYFEIILSNDINFNLVVRFLNDKNKPYKYNNKREGKFDIIFLILYVLFGLGLTILFIYLFNKGIDLKYIIINGVISFLYMALSLFGVLVSENMNKLKALMWSILVPIIYTIVLFVILFFLSDFNTSTESLINYIMWSIYTMPSFILVIALVVLCCMG